MAHNGRQFYHPRVLLEENFVEERYILLEKANIRMKIILWDLCINVIAASPLVPREMRFLIYRTFGINLKTRAFNPGGYIGGNQISIGKGSYINYKCYFDNTSPIDIGENCNIAMEVMFATSTHESGTPERRAGMETGYPIKVGNGCWVGARSTILAGVTIGDGCIIAAGSVVNKNCEPNGLYAGVPAKRIKDI